MKVAPMRLPYFKHKAAVALALAGLLTSTSGFATTIYQYRVAAKGLIASAPVAPPVTPTDPGAAKWLVTAETAFGPAPVSGPAVSDLFVTVSNNGSAGGTPQVSAFTGTNASDFSVRTNSCNGVIGVGAECQVSVQFQPATGGDRTASLEVAGTTLTFTGTGTLPSDSLFKNVSLLMHMDGANGSTSFPDVKGATFLAAGTPFLSTSTFISGTSAAYFNGTSDYLQTSSSTSFTGPYSASALSFTVEFWMNPMAYAAGGAGFEERTIMSSENTGGKGWRITMDTSGIVWRSAFGAVNYGTSDRIVPVSLNTWTHFAVVFSNGMVTLYKDGVTAYGQNYPSMWPPALSDPLRIGARYGASPMYYYKGYLDDIRITKGVARYSGNFTPPSRHPDQ
jgi:hypothetical protein